MKFLQLKPDERMIGIYRPYGLTYAGAVIVSFILWILPFFLLGQLFQRGKWGLLGFALLVALALWYSLG
ncbi:hypothetical protein HY628_00280, partial [Candidatus Uhrbacteria bacterium]|nr:hypothetical protein [Candidatus Uhrbacteria bacterium]